MDKCVNLSISINELWMSIMMSIKLFIDIQNSFIDVDKYLINLFIDIDNTFTDFGNLFIDIDNYARFIVKYR